MLNGMSVCEGEDGSDQEGGTNSWVDVKAPRNEMAMDAAIMPAFQWGSS